jgi:3'(2'), 5'-bisphosphate nucleotidase
MHIPESLIVKVLHTAVLAGSAIMDIYKGNFEVEFKNDNSPLTAADKKANSIIAEGLSDMGLPYLSEEGAQTEYSLRKNWRNYWLVDPLDGTKEFIKKNGDFTVNIALISDQHPVLGVVYAPVHGYIFWGSNSGSFRLDVNNIIVSESGYLQKCLPKAERLPCVKRTDGFIVLGSRSHMNVETESYISGLQLDHPDISFISKGSSLKFCLLAEGNADIYPRFGPTMEWDTAAGHAVALYAGCVVEQAANGKPVLYNKPSLLNPFFIAKQKK